MSTLDSAAFVERYGRYFNSTRIDGIAGMGFLFVEGRADGVYFEDTSGNRILDMWCMGGTFSLGHRNPAVMKTARAALEEEDFGSLFFFSEAKGELARLLADHSPEGLQCTHPTVTGAEAVDLAIKIARGATGRSQILHADHAYHGCTGLALSMMAKGEMRDFAEPLAPGFAEVRYGDIEDLRRHMTAETAAIVLEPVRTDYDAAAPPDGYFQAVRQLCDEHGAKLIVDEVVCGMGRLGTLWGSERQGILPDIMVTGKGSSGGVFPISAVVTRPEVLDFFAASPYRTISSFAWSNVGARIGATAIEETLRVLPQANAMAEVLERGVCTLQQRYASKLRAIRRTGLIFALDFADESAGMMFMGMMFAAGVLVAASSQSLATLKIYPPLVLEEAEVLLFLERMEGVLKMMP